MKIPIIFYHALFDKQTSNEKYSIDEEAFKQQIKYLAEYGFKGLLLEDLFTSHSRIDKRKKYVIITFDDGSYSDYSTAFPILKEYKFPATFFVTVNWIGTEDYVTWENLEEMAANGMSIQSHSLTHPFLSDCDSNSIYKELGESKDMLEKKLKRPVRFISMPGGSCSKKVLSVAKDLHYRGVCTSKPGAEALCSQHNELATFARLLITRKTSFKEFKSIVNGDRKLIRLYKAEYYFKNIIRKILGNNGYYKLWSKFLRKV
jgi:peptidoglycan/xylan/chitin deacetylase (PgdA/CDA1 family)